MGLTFNSVRERESTSIPRRLSSEFLKSNFDLGTTIHFPRLKFVVRKKNSISVRGKGFQFQQTD